MTRQAGATLVEVLITLLILKVGLLGVLAAQLQALRLVTDATQQTTALALSRHIHQQLATVYQPNLQHDFLIEQPINAASCLAATPCQPKQFEQYLVSRWQQHYLTDTALGMLFEPVFCLRRQQGQLQIVASWQSRSAFSTITDGQCGTNEGRAALRLGQDA